jgi:hypothetical protein
MRTLPPSYETFVKHSDGGYNIAKRVIAEYFTSDFFDAINLWVTIKKYGFPWASWLDAPAHLFEMLAEFDRVFDAIMASKGAISGGKR